MPHRRAQARQSKADRIRVSSIAWNQRRSSATALGTNSAITSDQRTPQPVRRGLNADVPQADSREGRTPWRCRSIEQRKLDEVDDPCTVQDPALATILDKGMIRRPRRVVALAVLGVPRAASQRTYLEDDDGASLGGGEFPLSGPVACCSVPRGHRVLLAT